MPGLIYDPADSLSDSSSVTDNDEPSCHRNIIEKDEEDETTLRNEHYSDQNIEGTSKGHQNESDISEINPSIGILKNSIRPSSRI